MSESQKKARREFRNLSLSQLMQYRLPVPGILSILHRVSGVLMFFCMPLVFVPFFAASVRSEESFQALGAGVSGFFLKLLLLVLIWGFMHHFCAGIRYLVLDMHVGVDKPKARLSAKIVFGASLCLTLVFAIKLFGVL
ncbi:succinate dehydrogenase, cytochrome b556 subunit [Brackiella oedipodis]|uniref:succinate dehydrogenase, cytochrome b556 subunit n=1 Tax=Brackiella oedipodis TaxID=124225 RepID=UPI00048F6F62|nr:succinate dehydrogenase, cytochrome b556 subunit [Brackiella oedipodis]